jgi:hypothetical protein
MSQKPDKLVYDFARLPPAMTVKEAQRALGAGMRGGLRYGVIVAEDSHILACITWLHLDSRPPDAPLATFRSEWPALWTLPARDAADLRAVALFFEEVLQDDEGLVGIVLTDDAGLPAAILPKRVLFDALAVAPTQRDWLQGQLVAKGVAERERGELMVRRYGRLDFPAEVALDVPCTLCVTIRQAAEAGAAGQVELGLTARAWPLKVVATLVGVRLEDFLVEGPVSGVIEVPRDTDSAPLNFTLIPQSLGRKRLRIRFEQNNAYLGTALLETEVVPTRPEVVAPAKVKNNLDLPTQGLSPDFTILIEHLEDLTYSVKVKRATDDGEQPMAEVDRVTFAKPPDVYLQTLFEELNTKTAGKLTSQEFDAEVAKLGNRLYEDLFHNADGGLPGFKSFYHDELYPASERGTHSGGGRYVPTVQIVSDEPYIPWEILRGTLRDAQGKLRADPLAFCERFNLARWLAGPGPGHKLPILEVVLVAPPSNLKFVRQEVDALRGLPGLRVKVIESKPDLEAFLQDGRADVLHFACHGAFNADLPARSAVKLGDRFLRAAELTPPYRNFALGRPLVFMNACDSGRLGVGLTGLDGWAEAFIAGDGGKAGVFIGSVWQTTDELASQFAAVFYERLLAGDPLAEAMRQARAAVRRFGDATYLSYTLYANPKVRAARATLPA